MSVAGCLAGCEGVGFSFQLENSLPAWVVGDETRVFHLLLQMVGALLSHQRSNSGGRLLFSVSTCTAGQEDCIPAQPNLSPGCSICVKFQVAMERSTGCSQSPSTQVGSQISMCKFQAAMERSVGCCRSPGTPVGSEISMSKKIVQMMNGSMRSASDGETIALFLQFQLQQSGVCRTPSSVPRLDGLRILLADGDGMSQAVTQKLLEKLGCQVVCISSGAQCLALLGSTDSSFQLLLLDIDMDAFEVALRIRGLRNRCWLLIVSALAVSVDDGIREMCRRSGINGLIQKPMTLTALGAQLYRVLRN